MHMPIITLRNRFAILIEARKYRKERVAHYCSVSSHSIRIYLSWKISRIRKEVGEADKLKVRREPCLISRAERGLLL